jgi:hypothetical protein
VDAAEVAVRELVVPLGLLVHLGVDAEVPLPVLTPAVLVEVGILLVSGRCVFAPVVPLVLGVCPFRTNSLAWSKATLFNFTVIAYSLLARP